MYPPGCDASRNSVRYVEMEAAGAENFEIKERYFC